MKEWSRPADWRGGRQGLRVDGGDGDSFRHLVVRWLRTLWARCTYSGAYFDELANGGEPYIGLAEVRPLGTAGRLCRDGDARDIERSRRGSTQWLARKRAGGLVKAAAPRRRGGDARASRLDAAEARRTLHSCCPGIPILLQHQRNHVSPDSETRHVRNEVHGMEGRERPRWGGVRDRVPRPGGGRSRPDFSSGSWLFAHGGRQEAPPPGRRHRSNPLRHEGLQRRVSVGGTWLTHLVDATVGADEGGQEPPRFVSPLAGPPATLHHAVPTRVERCRYGRASTSHSNRPVPRSIASGSTGDIALSTT